MTDDRGRYLTNLEGFTHEAFGGDPEEIVLRIARVGEGARTLGDLAREVREEAQRYGRLQEAGWRLVEPFRDGEARCRKVDDAGGAPDLAARPRPVPPPTSLQTVVEGAADLPAAAAQLKVAASAFEDLAAEGRRLADPVVAGRVPLE